MKLKNCTGCSLSKTRANVVVGKGSLNAKVVFLGDLPIKKEDESGIPFIGKEGKMFDKVLKAAGLSEGDYYVTNVIKCRNLLPNGMAGKPTPEQIVKCGRWLNIQLNRIKPGLIVAMGGYAKDRLLDLPGPVSRFVGKAFVSETYNTVFVMYHPATLLYNYDEYRPKFRKHLAKLRQLIAALDLENENYWNKIEPNAELDRIWQKK